MFVVSYRIEKSNFEDGFETEERANEVRDSLLKRDPTCRAVVRDMRGDPFWGEVPGQGNQSR